MWEFQNLLLIFFLPINSEGLEYKNGPRKEHMCAGQPQLGEVSRQGAGSDTLAAGISEGIVHSHSYAEEESLLAGFPHISLSQSC